VTKWSIKKELKLKKTTTSEMTADTGKGVQSAPLTGNVNHVTRNNSPRLRKKKKIAETFETGPNTLHGSFFFRVNIFLAYLRIFSHNISNLTNHRNRNYRTSAIEHSFKG